MYVTTAKQDTDGLCAIHLAVKCSGPDINFKKTCEVLESLRYVAICIHTIHVIQ